MTNAFKGTQDIEQVVPNKCLELLTAVFNCFGKSIKRKRNYGSFWKESMNLSDKTGIIISVTKGRRGPVGHEHRNPDEELQRILATLEEQQKLPRRVVLTRWLSSREAIKVIVTSRETYKKFCGGNLSEGARKVRLTTRPYCHCDVLLFVRRLASAD